MLSVGSIADDPRDEIAVFQPFFEHVAAQMTDPDYRGARIVVARSIEKTTEFIISGEVDLYLDSLYPASVVMRETGSDVPIRRWEKGAREYHSVLFVRADADIESLADLIGHTVAFEEEFSTSGYRLPLSMILDGGLEAHEVASESSEVPADAVAYLFSGDDENTISWVLASSGRVEFLELRHHKDVRPRASPPRPPVHVPDP